MWDAILYGWHEKRLSVKSVSLNANCDAGIYGLPLILGVSAFYSLVQGDPAH